MAVDVLSTYVSLLYPEFIKSSFLQPKNLLVLTSIHITKAAYNVKAMLAFIILSLEQSVDPPSGTFGIW